MDIELRFIGGDESYKIDEWMVEELSEFTSPQRIDILHQIEEYCDDLPEKDGWTQYVAGVIREEPTLYFKLEYLKQNSEHPIFLSVTLIDADEFLDYINLHQTLKQWKK